MGFPLRCNLARCNLYTIVIPAPCRAMVARWLLVTATLCFSFCGNWAAIKIQGHKHKIWGQPPEVFKELRPARCQGKL